MRPSLAPFPLWHCLLFPRRSALFRPLCSSSDHSPLSLAPNVSPSDESDYLLDSFGRFHNYLRVSLVEKCNLRCLYCMPEEGVPLCAASSYLSSSEIVRLVRLFAQNGVDKVRLTGGEPTIRKDLVPIVSALASLPQIRRIGMTTNGIVLNRMIGPLVEAGLTHLNISLDTLSSEKYANITRRNAFAKAMAGIEAAERTLPEGRLKINCVVMRGINDDELTDFVKLTAERCLDIRFIEFMPFSGNRFQKNSFVAYKEMLAKLEEHFGKGQIERMKDAPNDSSKKLQPPQTDRRRKSEGVSPRIGGSVVARPVEGGRGRRPTFGTDWGGSEAKTRAPRGSREAHSAGGLSARTANDSNWRLIRSVRPPSLRPSFSLPSSVRFSSSSSSFSHLDPNQGDARMVDVSSKKLSSQRIALARAIVKFPTGVLPSLIAHSPKGDFLSVSRVAGILAAKKTHHLVPLCHPIALSHVQVSFQTDHDIGQISVFCRVTATHSQTGVEMEAMVGCSVAALCLYDMTKSASLHIRIEAVELVGKRGGRRDFGRVDEEQREEKEEEEGEGQRGEI